MTNEAPLKEDPNVADRPSEPQSESQPGQRSEPTVDAGRFYSAATPLDEIGEPPESQTVPALKRLGPLPMARGSFPLMGFLATCYDHISGHAQGPSQSAPRP